MQSWGQWIEARSHIAAKLKGADRQNAEAYFLKLHAASEAYFRRMMFVGLRLKLVSYDNANRWLHNNDSTPDKDKFPKKFNKLYEPTFSFEAILDECPNGNILWGLWLDFAKPMRNHLAHGIRQYTADWLECGIRINQGLLIELDGVMAKHFGNSIVADLTKLKPRLPQGRKDMDIPALLGTKQSSPKRFVTLKAAKDSLISAGWYPLE